MSILKDRSVLMRFSVGMPGKHRKDKKTTEEVKREKAMGKDSGGWVADLWPAHALKAVGQKQTEAGDYHRWVTFPFGVPADSDEAGDGKATAIGGIGVLPGVLIMEYRDKVADYCSQMEKLVADFLADPQQWIDWAVTQHNGSFNPKNYPGCSIDDTGKVVLDCDEFRKQMRKKFYMRTEPLPVPESEAFSASMSALLALDAESVNLRVADAELQVKRELMRRLIAPVQAMAAKLAEPAKEGKDSPIFRDTLVQNIKDIASLAPKLNIAGDPAIDAFCQEIHGLTLYHPDTLRKSAVTREQLAAKARAMADKMAAYQL